MTEKRHSKLGASSAKRWLSCAASVALIEQAPPAPPSKAADEGTLAHTWFEYILATELLKADAPFDRPKVSREMENYVQDCINWVEENYMPELGDELLLETEVDLSWIDKDMFGTLDIAIIRPGGKLTIGDLKYGFGEVDPEENDQLMYYALGIAKKYDYNFTEVEHVVLQPRAPVRGETIRSWTCSVDKLKSFEYILKKGAERVRRGNNKPFPGEEWCRFCSGKVICPAFEKKAMESARAVFADEGEVVSPTMLPALPDPRDLEPHVLTKVLDSASLLDKWIEGVREYAEDFVRRGGKIPGYGLVPKKAQRKWRDEARFRAWAQDVIGDEAFELRSPAQIEKMNVPGIKQIVLVATEKVSNGDKLAPVHAPNEFEIDTTKSNTNSLEGNHGEKESGKKGRKKKDKVEAAKKIFTEEDGSEDNSHVGPTDHADDYGF